MSIKHFLKGSESLSIVVPVLPRYLHLGLVDHGLIKAVATHWTGCYSTPAIATFPDVAREDLFVVGLDDRAHVRGGSVGYFQLSAYFYGNSPFLFLFRNSRQIYFYF